MNKHPRTLVAVATYNEIENLPRLVDEIFDNVPDVDILVIDDNSPDGTGRWCDKRAAGDSRLRCIHRERKLGLGSATIAGFRFALEEQYDLVLTMDADFSHHPRHLPEILRPFQEENNKIDVNIGSRYVAGGGIEGWPLYRRLMSWSLNHYARILLSLRVRDLSGAFRCYRTDVLRKLDFEKIRSQGYSYLEEILWLLKRQGVRFSETPITFVDRQAGQTKINSREALTAIWIITRLGIRNWLGI